MDYDAVLLDNDGVITHETEREVLARAVHGAFRDMGVKDPDPADVDRLVIGVQPEDLEAVSTRYELDPETFWYRRDLRYALVQEREMRAGNKPLYDDFSSLSTIDLPMGIVSSNQHRTIQSILDHYGLHDRFGTYYGREMEPESLVRKKPATYYLDRAVEDLGASNPIFVGDSASDIEAATAAGMDSVFVRRDRGDGDELSVAPTHEVESLAELPRLVNGDPG